MVFSEHLFLLVFLPVCLAGFHLLRHMGLYRGSALWLVLFSFIFYGYWNVAYLAILIISIFVNYLLGLYLYRANKSFASFLAMLIGVAFNLGLILYFKYAGFLLYDVAQVSELEWLTREILLPIGISFFTFQQVAYIVDCRAGRTYEPSLINYMLFISCFPQLIAGPVVNHKYVGSQYEALTCEGQINQTIIKFGLILFVIGLAKKVLLADTIGRGVDPMFDVTLQGGDVGFWQAWFMVSAYRVQLYFDFSGYSDMAIGLAALFGFRLPINFNSPYKSKSIIELWGRWHMTLSRFVRDYVYIPLGGSRRGKAVQLRNIFIGMFLIGIWHGAAWTFVWYALAMSSAVCFNHLVRIFWPAFTAWETLPARAFKQALTLLFYFGTGALFRAENMDSANAILYGLFGLGHGEALAFPIIEPMFLIFCIIALCITLYTPNSLQITRYTEDLSKSWPNEEESAAAVKPKGYGYVEPISLHIEKYRLTYLICGLLVAVCIAAGWQPAIFIYFNF